MHVARAKVDEDVDEEDKVHRHVESVPRLDDVRSHQIELHIKRHLHWHRYRREHDEASDEDVP